MKILAIETSCDETSIALLEAKGGLRSPRFRVIENYVSSQIKIHRPFGGVVPNLAKREHLKNLPLILKKMEKKIDLKKDVDALAVTIGPGLEPALWTGIAFAKNLAKEWKKPLLAVNHLKGHLYSFLLETANNLRSTTNDLFPAVALIVSGGHTILLKMDSLTKFKKLGETRDDAAGEAFDKIARLLNLPYPGGPEIEKAGRRGDPSAVNFPRPMLNAKNYDFSFAGLKTSVFYYLKQNKFLPAELKKISNFRLNESKNNLPLKRFVDNVAASFEQAAIDVLVKKTIRAIQNNKAKNVFLSGGVAANKKLRKTFKKELDKINCGFIAPSRGFNTDNAAIIAVAAYISYLQKEKKRIYARANITL